MSNKPHNTCDKYAPLSSGSQPEPQPNSDQRSPPQPELPDKEVLDDSCQNRVHRYWPEGPAGAGYQNKSSVEEVDGIMRDAKDLNDRSIDLAIIKHRLEELVNREKDCLRILKMHGNNEAMIKQRHTEIEELDSVLADAWIDHVERKETKLAGLLWDTYKKLLIEIVKWA
ncbi:hypothetical protein EDC01DRAFT_636100 [Geopyxis carbonaria]|nr:hypothetical protein EDC01DRAFT_636100 [Geopyxis carbonaria]